MTSPTARIAPLDGLRAVSMGAVLLYHGEVGIAPGGFLGISLFFTLSGYLITSLLLGSADPSGRIDVRTFWVRRYRRLLPAAYVTLAGILVFGATVATEQQLDDLPGSVAAALLQVANWFFVVTGRSYAAIFAAPSPVQHFWSLSIEEQFYLLLPLLLVGLRRWTRSERVLAGVLAAGVVASTVAMVVLFERGATVDRLYYGTDTRAAELLVGGLLAVVLRNRPLRSGGRAATVRAAVGLGSVGVLMWGWNQLTVTDAVLYRGGFLVAALLSMAVILGLLDGRGPLAWLLGWGPVAAFGRITYGVYLIHWPVFLWLTPQRTSLATVPLLALRLAVTLLLATASYHLVEMPIRQRRWPAAGAAGRLVVPLGAACALTVAAVAVGARDVETDLAGLGEDLVAPPPVAPPPDEPLSVLLVTDRADGHQPLGGLEPDAVEVAVAPPFRCTGIEAGGSSLCANWRQDWGPLVAAVDPDVVLFDVWGWPDDDLGRWAGSDDVAEQTRWAVDALDAGMDVLTDGGATVVWTPEPITDAAEALRRAETPFHAAMLRVAGARPDTRQRGSTDPAPAALLADLELYSNRSAPAPRVMVVGDSTARTLADGFERWAADTDAAVVWSGATQGCGLIDEGRTRDLTGRLVPVSPVCVGLVDSWADAATQFQPDAIIVLSQVFDLQDRELDGQVVGPGHPTFDRYLVDRYLETYDALGAGRAQVVWLTNPCGEGGDGEGAFDPERVRHVNDELLPEVQAARPALRIFDLYSRVCPGDGGEPLRPDGLHFSAEGSRRFADAHGRELLDTALGDP